MEQGAKKGYVDTSEGQVHYQTQGEGEPLVLLHQNPRSSREFTALIPKLAEHHQVYALDSLGCGNSDPLPEKFEIKDLAQNVVHVMDALGLESSDLFGCHTGSLVAGEVAASWPERIRRLVVMGYTFTERGEERETAFNWAVPKTRKLVERGSEGSHLQRQWAWAYSQVMNKWFHTGVTPSPVLSEEESDFLQLVMLDIAQIGENAPRIYEAVFTYDWEATLPRIKARTLFVQLDSHTEPIFCKRADLATDLMPDASVLKLAESDHNAAEWRADDLAKIISDFVRSA